MPKKIKINFRFIALRKIKASGKLKATVLINKAITVPIGTPFAKTVQLEDGQMRTEIRLNVSKTNILRPASRDEDAIGFVDQDDDEEQYGASLDDFTMDEDDF